MRIVLLSFIYCSAALSLNIPASKIASVVALQLSTISFFTPIDLDQTYSRRNNGVSHVTFLYASSSQSNDSPSTLYNKANIALMTGNFEDSLELLNQYIAADGSNPDAFITRGITNEKLFHWTEAIADYKTAEKVAKGQPFSFLRGDDAVIYSNLGNAETGLGLWKDALRDFSIAERLKPDFMAPKIGKALVLYQLGDTIASQEYFDSIVNQYPNFADGQAARAIMLFSKGELSAATEAWERALEQDSRYIDIEWVRDIRRWPPALIEKLVSFKAQRTTTVQSE